MIVKIIHFTNGKELKISEEEYEYILQWVTDRRQFLILNRKTKDEVLIMINQINYIK